MVGAVTASAEGQMSVSALGVATLPVVPLQPGYHLTPVPHRSCRKPAQESTEAFADEMSESIFPDPVRGQGQVVGMLLEDLSGCVYNKQKRI